MGRDRRGRAWALPLLAAGLTLAVELFNHRAFTDGPGAFFAFLGQAPLAALANALLVLGTLLPALLLRRRVFWCALVSAVWLGLGAANGFILLSRTSPFTVVDLTMLGSGLDTLPSYLAPPYIALLAGALLALMAGLALLFWKGPRGPRLSRRRLLSGAAALAVCAGALAGTGAAALHTGQLSHVFANLPAAYEDYGFAYCFLQTWLNRGVRQPRGYSAPALDRVRETIRENTPAGIVPVDANVVFLQLESFIDPAEISGLELSAPAAPCWTALAETCSTGYLTVPVVGGGTANTECEVLTGMSVRYFGPGEYPYQTCLETQAAESVAYNLKAHGYGTHAIHNNRADFYGRDRVYANLGFDDFTSLEYMPRTETTPNGWARDYILTGQVLQALDATEGRPDLVFAVSVQGHGKYPEESGPEAFPIAVTACPEGVDPEAAAYYVEQVREMDAVLGRLTAALSRREERTVLVAYGDHLPALGLEARDMAAGDLYRTEYLIWDNFGLEKRDGNLSACQLSAAALSRIGVTDGAFNGLHQFCREEPAYRSDLRLLQYDTLCGRRFLYGGGRPYVPTDLRMGAVPMAVTGLEQRGEDWYVRGAQFSPYCQVVRDGRPLETVYVSPWLLRLEEDPETDRAEELTVRVVDSHGRILSETGAPAGAPP